MKPNPLCLTATTHPQHHRQDLQQEINNLDNYHQDPSGGAYASVGGPERDPRPLPARSAPRRGRATEPRLPRAAVTTAGLVSTTGMCDSCGAVKSQAHQQWRQQHHAQHHGQLNEARHVPCLGCIQGGRQGGQARAGTSDVVPPSPYLAFVGSALLLPLGLAASLGHCALVGSIGGTVDHEHIARAGTTCSPSTPAVTRDRRVTYARRKLASTTETWTMLGRHRSGTQ
eukprot:scaffold4868_cov416-Prasinococcus_capsulatus_cf.AAC.36